MRLERCAPIRRGERPVRRPLFAQVDADADVVKNALLVLEWPQGAAVQQACRNGLVSSPTVETAVASIASLARLSECMIVAPQSGGLPSDCQATNAVSPSS